jgi:hypothetical protein
MKSVPLTALSQVSDLAVDMVPRLEHTISSSINLSVPVHLESR